MENKSNKTYSESNGKHKRVNTNKWYYLKPFQRLRIKTAESIKNEFGDIYNAIIESGICEHKFDCTPDIKEQLVNAGFIEINGIKISGDVIETVGALEVEPTDKITYSIRRNTIDQKVIEHMISLVNQEVLLKTFNTMNNKRQTNPRAIRKYLEDWAMSKYDFFYLFGGKLKFDVELDATMSDEDFKEEYDIFLNSKAVEKYRSVVDAFHILDLKENKFERTDFDSIKVVFVDTFISSTKVYGGLLNCFTIKNFLEDSLPECEVLQKYFGDRYVIGGSIKKLLLSFDDELFSLRVKELYAILGSKTQKGAKVSRLLNKMFGDNDLNIAYSMLLNKVNEKGCITYSIDPVDYMLISVNQHGWGSCQRIIDASREGTSTAALSLMRDETTIVAYKHNRSLYNYDKISWRMTSGGRVAGTPTVYDFGQNSFSWISMQKRELIFIDKSTCGMAFALGYCSFTDSLYKLFREGIEERIANYFGVENVWTINSLKEVRLDISHRSNGDAYSDPLNHFAYLKNAANIHLTNLNFGGFEKYCLCCGRGSHYTYCNQCQSERLSYNSETGRIDRAE